MLSFIIKIIQQGFNDVGINLFSITHVPKRHDHL